MTPAGELLAQEIRQGGPISFQRFMEVALYHPECGYYRRGRDPFGKRGDYYTAEQLQPVFGSLIAARIRTLYQESGSPGGFTVVELGSGRGEMAADFSEWRYVPVEIGGELSEQFCGVVFSNEFFDALPVDVAIYTRGEFRQRLVTWRDGRFAWATDGQASPLQVDYLRRYFPPPEEGRCYEVSLPALEWMERISRHLQDGWVFTIDYGYTLAEAARFAGGTLMSYRRHLAQEDVLSEPGERDLTAHVNFTALADHGTAFGLRMVRLETLAQTLIAAGEAEFAKVLASPDAAEESRRRLQLKTLLFGMGETFRVLWQWKEEEKFGGKSL